MIIFKTENGSIYELHENCLRKQGEDEVRRFEEHSVPEVGRPFIGVRGGGYLFRTTEVVEILHQDMIKIPLGIEEENN